MGTTKKPLMTAAQREQAARQEMRPNPSALTQAAQQAPFGTPVQHQPPQHAPLPEQQLQEPQSALIPQGNLPNLPEHIGSELEQMRRTAKMLDAGGSIMQGGPPSPPPVALAHAWNDPAGWVWFELYDGREIAMGPPDKPTFFVVPAMFKNREIVDNIEDQAHFTAAKIMQYVRHVGGRNLPGYISRFEDVSSLMHELGDLGCRAVYENYAIHWPDVGGLYWTELKKNVPGSRLP